MPYFSIDYGTRQTEHVGFNLRDAKGRYIGARITFAQGEFKAEQLRSEDFGYTVAGYYHAPAGSPDSGEAFCMDVQATRNGVDYGASQRWQVFATAAEREAARVKYLDAARKRAAKARP